MHMSRKSEDLRLLEIDVDTMFVVSVSGRIERENDPDRSPGPRVFFAGCPAGNVASLRYDVDDRIGESVLDIAAKEPPWSDFDAMPRCASKIAELLSAQDNVIPALIYQLPNYLRYEHRTTIVRGDSAEGERLLAHLAERGMPEYMAAAGFRSTADFWKPWCVALDGKRGEIASMAFAARLGEMGAEIGVYTFPQYRGRGLAAAVTAAWASMPALKDRALFYSTSKSNRSSQQAAARLGLRRIGASLRIS